jgi:hypothetical protein
MSLARCPFELPVGYTRVKVVNSFEELIATPFGNGVNALCWPRSLEGDFEEVALAVPPGEEITTLDAAQLGSLALSPAGRAAVEILLEDQRRLRAAGLAPVLDCIRCYPRDEEGGVVPTDVYSFHADSAPVATDTFLCSYTESSSEGLRNEEALRCIDVPAIRAELLASFGGKDDAAFLEYLRETCYDLHYVAVPQAQPFSFGLGNLWRIAVDYPGSPVPPCVHRAPATIPGRPPRLLLIS